MTTLTAILIGFFLGCFAGSLVTVLILRPFISSKKNYVGKIKQRGGPGNVQDLEMEFKEAEQLNRRDAREARRGERKTEKLSKKLNKKEV